MDQVGKKIVSSWYRMKEFFESLEKCEIIKGQKEHKASGMKNTDRSADSEKNFAAIQKMGCPGRAAARGRRTGAGRGILLSIAVLKDGNNRSILGT